MVHGRKPNWERRQRILKLRERGLSLPEIGRRLGVTFQCVDRTLRKMADEWPRSVPCAGCGEDIVSAGAVASDHGLALCLSCLAKRPNVPFGQRLRAVRLAGLTRAELAARCGWNAGNIQEYEMNRSNPKWPAIVRLIRVLGIGLVALGFEDLPDLPPRNGHVKKPNKPR